MDNQRFSNKLNLRSLTKKIISDNLTLYNWSTEEYQTKIINDMVFDEKKRIVSIFKDFLLLDETSDFLRRYILFNS
jgi:hypothetical protein